MAKKKTKPSGAARFAGLVVNTGNPELALAMREKRRSGAAGIHETRPKGFRDRSNTKRNTIAAELRSY